MRSASMSRLRPMQAPYAFKHELDPDLFTLDRLDALFRRAPKGKAGAQLADEGRVRAAGTGPQMTDLRGSISDDVAARGLHIHMHDLTEWAPEYAASREHILEAAGIDRAQPMYHETTVIRIFSADVPVALHGDGETQINCGLGGRNLWHAYPPSGLSQVENEALLRGGQFLPWREMPLFASYDLHPGDGFAAPPRWPHWIEHPGPDPAVSFEVGYWVADDIRDRKVWEVNWLLRKAKLAPRPPGENAALDRRKQKVFDLVSLVTRKGAEFRDL
jgi:hypothetical protein